MSEAKKISNVLENYIEIIYEEEMREGAARASTIAEKASVSRSTVTSALKSLKEMGLIEYSPYSLIHLTAEGKDLGRDISHRHEIFKAFFQNILMLEEKEADDVACELEHVVSLSATRKLGQFLVYLNTKKELYEGWEDEYNKMRKEHLREIHKKEIEKKSLENTQTDIDIIAKYL